MQGDFDMKGVVLKRRKEYRGLPFFSNMKKNPSNHTYIFGAGHLIAIDY